MYKSAFSILAVLILALLGHAHYALAGNGQTEQVVLEVKNMSCLSCAALVKKSLKRLNGVKEIKVTLDPPEAVVIFDPTKIKAEDLIRATTNAGYPSAVKRKN